jgi:ABC-type multidrug transport system fused ATPase/permease subunit
MGILLIAAICAEIAEPLVISYFIEFIQFGGKAAAAYRLIELFFAVTICRHVLKLAATALSEKVAWTSTNALRGDMADHILRLDLNFHASRSRGELIERIDGDVNQIADLFSSFIVQLLGNALLLLGILVALTLIDPILSLSAVFAIVIGGLALQRVQRISREHWQADREQAALFYGSLSESLGAAEDLRPLDAVPYAMIRFYRRLRAWAPVRTWAEAWGSSIWVIMTLVLTAITACAFGLGAALYRSGAISLGQVYLIVTYISMIMAPMEVIREQVAYLQQAIAAVRRVRELLSTSSRLVDGVELIVGGPLSVDFDGVSFGYADGDVGGSGPAVLDELSFHLDKGRKLGLVGRTGAGKTTIAHLLFRMYDPQRGRVQLGGVDLATARIASVRSRVGFVTQDVHIFSASVRDNLTFFDGEIPDQRLTEILGRVGLTPWLESLPNGLSTPISGDTVSVGQGQLIGLARVFIKDPGLVILDEPSSSLDPATEAMLMTALDSLLADRTAVLISHSLATFSRADEILMIDEGRIAEYGKADQLLSDPGSRLAQLRGLGEA